jgi:glycolate oxidase iron-sulfur subunit
MQLARDGAAGMTPQWVGHFDTCLGCMACMPACPSGVQYDQLIEATRGQIARGYERPWSERLYRRLLFATLPRPDRLRLLRWPMAVYQRSGLQRLVRKSGLLRALPRQLQTLEALMPALDRREDIAPVTPPRAESSLPRAKSGLPRAKSRGRVGVLLGCVQREFLSPVNAATVRVLAAEGYEVVAPLEQSCCGALMTHAGETAGAVALAKRMIDVFDRAGVDTVVINAAGCGSAMKEYGRLLRDDPAYAGRAAAFSAKCRDVTELLSQDGPRAVRHPLPLRVAYQDACHLQHAQGVRAQPRALLAQIPGLELLELPEAALCCGSAGIYNLVQPETANELGDRKAQHVAALGPDVVATGNPGCLLQLHSALARAGHPARVVHTIQVIDASISGAKHV